MRNPSKSSQLLNVITACYYNRPYAINLPTYHCWYICLLWLNVTGGIALNHPPVKRDSLHVSPSTALLDKVGYLCGAPGGDWGPNTYGRWGKCAHKSCLCHSCSTGGCYRARVLYAVWRIVTLHIQAHTPTHTIWLDEHICFLVLYRFVYCILLYSHSEWTLPCVNLTRFQVLCNYMFFRLESIFWHYTPHNNVLSYVMKLVTTLSTEKLIQLVNKMSSFKTRFIGNMPTQAMLTAIPFDVQRCHIFPSS